MVGVVPERLTAEQVRRIKSDLLALVVETQFIDSHQIEKLGPIYDQLLQNAHLLQCGQYDAATNLNKHKSYSSRSSTVRHKLKATLIACLALAYRYHNPHVQNVIWPSCDLFQRYWQGKSREVFPPFREGEDTWSSLFDFRNAVAILLVVAKGGKLIVKMAAGILSHFRGALSSGTPTHKIVRRDAIYKETLHPPRLAGERDAREVAEEEVAASQPAALPFPQSPAPSVHTSLSVSTRATASSPPTEHLSTLYGLNNNPRPMRSVRKPFPLSPHTPPRYYPAPAALPLSSPGSETSPGRRKRKPSMSLEVSDSDGEV